MGIAALVLGIVSIILGFIPFCGWIALIPAIIGLILGIVDLVKKSKSTEETKPKKGMSIAGVILSAIAIVIILLWTFVFGVAASVIGNNTNQIVNYLDDYNTNEVLGTVKVGQSYSDDKIKINFISADENFTGYSKYTTVPEGYKILKVTFDVENLSSEELYLSTYNFNCYADGYSCTVFYGATDSASLSSTLSTNKKTSGSVYYEVPATASEISIEYVLDTYSQNKVEFIVK